MAEVHATAIVDAGAELAGSVKVGPFSIVGKHVRIGEGTTIGSHCVLDGRTTIGRDNVVFQSCSIGAVPQDKKYAGEPTELHIGDRNTIREFCSIHIGTVQDKGKTIVGSDNWIMAHVHIAHDCVIGDQTIIASLSGLAGHVELGDWAIVGGQSGLHQFVKFGAHAMCGFASHVAKDVPPYMMVDGNPLAVRGFNAEGLRRRGYGPERIAFVKQMHKLLYRDGLTFDEARARIAAITASDAPSAGDLTLMNDFLAASTRGIAR